MSEPILDKPQPSQNDRINVKDNDQRFGIRPEARLLGIATGTALFGMFDGFYRGFTNSALVYLAENSHRLPRTVGGWYFYHKRKNYVCIKNGIVSGFKFSTKLTAIGLSYFGLEVFLDEARGQVDFLNTVVTTGAAAFAYAKYSMFFSDLFIMATIIIAFIVF